MTSTVIEGLTAFLEESLAPRVTMHGVLMEVGGLGVLLFGDSGVGKSECALALVQRGHRLDRGRPRRHPALPERRPRRLLVGPHPPPHGAARPRHRERPDALRRLGRSRAAHGRVRHPPDPLGRRARVRPSRARRGVAGDPRRRRPEGHDAGGDGAGRGAPRGDRRPKPAPPKRRGYNAAREMAAKVHDEIARKAAADRFRTGRQKRRTLARVRMR